MTSTTLTYTVTWYEGGVQYSQEPVQGPWPLTEAGIKAMLVTADPIDWTSATISKHDAQTAMVDFDNESVCIEG